MPKFTSIPLDENKLRSLIAQFRAAKTPYGLGKKARSLSMLPAKVGAIDCSGLVRYAVYQASGGKVVMPDGSWYQNRWAIKTGLKKSTVENGKLKDGRVRLAYWHNKSGVSHIALILNGYTLESHSGVGPNRRKWSPETSRWMREATIYVLEMDPDGAGEN